MIRPLAMAFAVVVFLTGCSPAPTGPDRWHGITHIVVIFQENHSFDNVYGGWGEVGGQKVNGRVGTPPSKTIQVAQDGTPLRCLLVIDENLASPAPLPTACTDPDHPAAQGTPPTVQPVNSHFINEPFSIDEFIPPSATTCSTSGAAVRNGTGEPGGCTSDLVHRFYQEQYQINGGRQNRYVAGSSAVGLTMAYYDTIKLPIYGYLHGPGAPPYKLADNFFQGAHGGSFLNHQFLVAAQPPLFAGADRSGQNTDAACATGTANCDLHSVVDVNGMPTSYPYYTADGGVVHDGTLTVAADASGACAPSFRDAAPTPAGTLCGDYAVNTIQPLTQPFQPGTAIGMRLPLLTGDNIGDALSEKGVSWKWYSGGWDNAAANNGHDRSHPLGPGWSAGPTGTAIGTCAPPPPAQAGAKPAGSAMPAKGAVFPYCPGTLFQYHHQPFGYFANYADGSPGRVEHLADEMQFRLDAAKLDGLPQVSFVKPYGAENEHPGYASATTGSAHLVDLIKMIVDGPNAANTLIIVTYDEFGGEWDHVAPPGTPDNPGPHDAYGPGTRIPTLLISAGLTSGVLKTQHDTSSVLATIEHRFGARTLRQPGGRPARDSQVADLWSAFS